MIGAWWRTQEWSGWVRPVGHGEELGFSLIKDRTPHYCFTDAGSTWTYSTCSYVVVSGPCSLLSLVLAAVPRTPSSFKQKDLMSLTDYLEKTHTLCFAWVFPYKVYLVLMCGYSATNGVLVMALKSECEKLHFISYGVGARAKLSMWHSA